MLVHTETCYLPLHLLFMFLMPFIYSLLTTPLVLRAIVLVGPTVLGHAMALVPAKAFAHEQHHLSLDGLYVCCTSTSPALQLLVVVLLLLLRFLHRCFCRCGQQNMRLQAWQAPLGFMCALSPAF